MEERTVNSRRGAAGLYALAIGALATIVLVAVLRLVAVAASAPTRVFREAQANLAMEGALADIKSDLKRAALTIPSTRTTTVGSLSVQSTISDNSSTLASTFRVDQTCTVAGSSYRLSNVLGNLATTTGLTAEYYSYPSTVPLGYAGTFLLKQIEPHISFNTSAAVAPGVPADNFFARWSGQVVAPTTKTYTFRVSTDDGARLWIDDRLVMNSWQAQAKATYTTVGIPLTAGQKVNLVYEYYEKTGVGVAILDWDLVTGTYSVVPKTSLLSQLGTRPNDPWGNVLTSANDLVKTTTFDITGLMHVNGKLSGGTTKYDGGVYATGTLSGQTGTGPAFASAPAVTVPTISNSDYTKAEDLSLGGKPTINGYTFPSDGYLIRCTGNSIDVSGTFTGIGTIYTNGKVNITGPITMGTPSSKLAIIAGSDIEFTSAATVSGFFFSGGIIKQPFTVTLASGAMVCQSFDSKANFTATYDSSLKTNSQLGSLLKLPGYWP